MLDMLGKSYHLVNVVVNSFKGEKFLQFPKGGACVFDITAKIVTKCSQSSPASSSEIDAIAEFDNLGPLLKENEKGSMHGVVGQVSPMTVGKMSKGYFHALLTDGAQDVKIVGFGKSNRNILKDFKV